MAKPISGYAAWRARDGFRKSSPHPTDPGGRLGVGRPADACACGWATRVGAGDWGRAAGAGARFLGSAAAARAARFVAGRRHPLHDRGRLSAVQLRRAGRQPAGLQCRSGAHVVRGAQARLHHPDAPFRDPRRRPQREPRRRRDRLDRGHPRYARQGRFHRSLLPHPRPVRGPARFPDRPAAAGEARRQEGRGGGGHGARRCGSPSTGRCFGYGSRAGSPTCGCAISRSARFSAGPQRPPSRRRGLGLTQARACPRAGEGRYRFPKTD